MLLKTLFIDLRELICSVCVINECNYRPATSLRSNEACRYYIYGCPPSLQAS